MATTYTCMLLHIIFSTKDREPLILPEVEPELYAYIGGICRNNGSVLLDANGAVDHLHLLISLGKTIAIADLMLQVKRDSSAWIKSKGPEFAGFHRQDGYASLSIGQSQMPAIKGYLAKQKEHHKRVSFRDEFIAFLQKYEIPFDERYLD